MGTLQKNPSDASDGNVQPDWNSANGQGVAPDGDDSMDLNEIYEAQVENEKERAAERDDDGNGGNGGNGGGGEA